MKLVHCFGGWVEGASKQTDRTDGEWVNSTFGTKAEQIKLLIFFDYFQVRCLLYVLFNGEID